MVFYLTEPSKISFQTAFHKKLSCDDGDPTWSNK